MQVDKQHFGHLADGGEVSVFTLRNRSGATARLSDYGASLLSLTMPDRAGVFDDVVLGYDTLAAYVADQASARRYLGATVGRVAGRISSGRFVLDGKHYVPGCNSGDWCLHGGAGGFSARRWELELALPSSEAAGGASIRFTCFDPGERSGFPGDLSCAVTYALGDDNVLSISYEATCDTMTPFNPTHHSYFNLGADATVLGHSVQLACAEQIALTATGEPHVRPLVAGYNDYRHPLRLDALPVLEEGNADFYGLLAGGRTAQPRFAARVHEPGSGRTLEVHTTEPGIVFYAGLWLAVGEAAAGKSGQHCGQHFGQFAGLCLEPQDFADSVHYPALGSAMLRPGERFSSCTQYRFSVD